MTATVATTSPSVGARPSAVTPRDLARAGADSPQPRQQDKIRVGVICTALVVVPVLLASVLPIPTRARRTSAGDACRRWRKATFGTDALGRDLLSLVLHGGQVSLTIGLLAVTISGIIGVVLGSAAGSSAAGPTRSSHAWPRYRWRCPC